MNLSVAIRIARRELRGGLSGFAVFLLCLILGVAAIAAVGTVRDSVRDGLKAQGAVLLGGDAELSFSYRFATPEERAWMDARAVGVSGIVDFRSMAVKGEGQAAARALTQVKGVDDGWPLTGAAVLDPAMPVAAALRDRGAVMDGVLADRLGLAVGDRFRLGDAGFTLRARLLREPDSVGGGFAFGPRTVVRTADLEGSGLLSPGSMYETRYRLAVSPGTDLERLKADALQAFRDKGMQWRDARRGAPGAETFVDRMGSFLVLVGLAGLAVGGIGVSSAVRSYLDRKTETIAALKAMGAGNATIFAAYLIQVAALAAAGIGLGVLVGGLAPVLAGPLIAARMPIPVEIAVQPKPLAEAAVYGVLTAALFALWPLARTGQVKAAALFRDVGPGRRAWPTLPVALALALILAALVGVATAASGVPWLALSTLGGVAGALLLLAGGVTWRNSHEKW